MEGKCLMKKVILVATALTAFSISSAQASTPNLAGYICVDKQGVHHMWQDAFNGSTYCKLIKNPNKKN